MSQDLKPIQTARKYGWSPAEQESPKDWLTGHKDFLDREVKAFRMYNPTNPAASIGEPDRTWGEVIASHEEAIWEIHCLGI